MSFALFASSAILLVLLQHPAAGAALPSDPRVALEEVRAFGTRMEPAKARFRTAVRRLTEGEISADAFDALITRELLPAWARERGALAARLTEAAPREAATLRELHLIAVGWESTLGLYAAGLREQQPDKVRQAFAQMRELADAEFMLERRLRKT
jgi:hypothetical protein